MMQVRRRIVKAKRHSPFLAGVRQLLDDVLPVRCICDLVVRIGRIKHAEAVVMLRCKYYVLLAGRSRQVDKSVRIELRWIESLGKLPILRFGDAACGWPHD